MSRIISVIDVVKPEPDEDGKINYWATWKVTFRDDMTDKTWTGHLNKEDYELAVLRDKLLHGEEVTPEILDDIESLVRESCERDRCCE